MCVLSKDGHIQNLCIFPVGKISLHEQMLSIEIVCQFFLSYMRRGPSYSVRDMRGLDLHVKQRLPCSSG